MESLLILIASFVFQLKKIVIMSVTIKISILTQIKADLFMINPDTALPYQ